MRHCHGVSSYAPTRYYPSRTICLVVLILVLVPAPVRVRVHPLETGVAITAVNAIQKKTEVANEVTNKVTNTASMKETGIIRVDVTEIETETDTLKEIGIGTDIGKEEETRDRDRSASPERRDPPNLPNRCQTSH
jgi:hypothetical protein